MVRSVLAKYLDAEICTIREWWGEVRSGAERPRKVLRCRDQHDKGVVGRVGSGAERPRKVLRCRDLHDKGVVSGREWYGASSQSI